MNAIHSAVGLERRFDLIRQVGEEIVTEEELRALLEEKPHPIAYDGFEPSGTAHIAQGVMRAINVNKMTAAGCRFKMFVADWHAWANNKMSGDFERIQAAGKYLIEIWRATGMDISNVDFVWASEFVEEEEYWKKVMGVARETSLDRVLRTTQIMGRSEKDKLSAAQILYPCMQAADIFHLEADITQLGMDQRKVNMLAREVGLKLGFWKPVVVSHHMLMGLTRPPPVQEPPGANAIYRTMEEKLAKAVATLVGETKQRAESELAEVRTRLAGGRPQPTLGGESSLVDSHRKRELDTTIEEILGAADPLLLARFQQVAESPASLLSFDNLLGIYKSLSTAPVSDIDKGLGQELRQAQLDNLGFRALLALLQWEAQELKKVRREMDEALAARATAMKMSKSNPDSAILMTDKPQEVVAKMRKAYCPEGHSRENPVLEYFQHIIFERFPVVTIERSAKFGGDVAFDSFDALRIAFESRELHPTDAKAAAARYINRLLDPVRNHFETNSAARELKERVERFRALS